MLQHRQNHPIQDLITNLLYFSHGDAIICATGHSGGGISSLPSRFIAQDTVDPVC